jgi:CheY-like chemotaxis protein
MPRCNCEGHVQRANLDGKQILVIEDDPVIAADYHFRLRRLGASDTIEPSNQRALAYLGTHHVDAAIVDYHLGDGPCVPVVEFLASLGIPFILVSGDTFAMRELPTGAPVLSKLATSIEVCQALSDVLN